MRKEIVIVLFLIFSEDQQEEWQAEKKMSTIAFSLLKGFLCKFFILQ